MLEPQASSPVSAGWPLLLTLLAVDGLALAGQLAGSVAVWLGLLPVTPRFLRLEEVHGFASLAVYAKWLAIALLLGLAWRADRQPLLLGLAVVFLALFLDDALELHERLGTGLARQFGLPGIGGLRGDDLGELAGWALIGGSALVLIAAGYRRSSPAARRLAQLFVAGLAVLALFGIGVDLLSAATRGMDHAFGSAFGARAMHLGLRLAEEGGELVIASLLVFLAFTAHRTATKAPAGLAGHWQAGWPVALSLPRPG